MVATLRSKHVRTLRVATLFCSERDFWRGIGPVHGRESQGKQGNQKLSLGCFDLTEHSVPGKVGWWGTDMAGGEPLMVLTCGV